MGFLEVWMSLWWSGELGDGANGGFWHLQGVFRGGIGFGADSNVLGTKSWVLNWVFKGLELSLEGLELSLGALDASLGFCCHGVTEPFPDSSLWFCNPAGFGQSQGHS